MIKVKILREQAGLEIREMGPATKESAASDLRVFLPVEGNFPYDDVGKYVLLEPGDEFRFHTGIAVEIPHGTALAIIPRSGLGIKGYHLSNVVGLIDSDYRGEILAVIKNASTEAIKVYDGMRSLQMIHIPIIPPEIEFVEELSETDRGEGGYGHTGVK